MFRMMGKSVLWGEMGGKPFEAQGKREKTNLDTKGNKVLRSLRKGEKEDGQIRTFDAAGASGGNPARGLHEAAGIVGEQAGAGTARAGNAHWGDRARAEADYGGLRRRRRCDWRGTSRRTRSFG